MLKEHALLVRSAEDANVYLVNDIQDPLQKSLTSLDLPAAVTPVRELEPLEEEPPLQEVAEEGAGTGLHPLVVSRRGGGKECLTGCRHRRSGDFKFWQIVN